MELPSILLPTCANWSSKSPKCGGKGTKACGNCKLVMYCGSHCQKSHWQEHKKICKCPMSKESWRPTWEREGREPAWAIGAAATNLHNPFGADKYLWGNTPALDILNLEHNEGLGYRDDIALLFAASGDLRHVITTVANLPKSISQPVTITINDREFDVVARSTILLLLALTTENTADRSISSLSETVDVLIHIWYSAFIPPNALSRLQSKVKPLIDEACRQIIGTSPDAIVEKSWKFLAGSSLRLVLRERDWRRLQALLKNDISHESATQIRRAITMAPSRADYRERWYFKEASPFMRIAKQKFHEDGLLLPFGYPRDEFKTPNPTFFHNSETWPMDDKADPSAGWQVTDVGKSPWPVKWDWYGKLYKHIFDVLKDFMDSLQGNAISFDLYNVDVEELPKHLQAAKYCRIEAANICDGGYVGIHKTLSLLSPLLQPPKRNPHASYIAIFINAVKEAVKMGDPSDETPDIVTINKHLPITDFLSLMKPNNAEMLRIWDARDLVLDVNKFFMRYMKFCNFEQISKDLKVEMKKSNTIVDMWPNQPKLLEGQSGAMEEFRLKLGSSIPNVECCVEWRRAD